MDTDNRKPLKKISKFLRGFGPPWPFDGQAYVNVFNLFIEMELLESDQIARRVPCSYTRVCSAPNRQKHHFPVLRYARKNTD